MSHYDEEFKRINEKNRKKEIESIKKQLPNLIDNMSDDELTYFFKVAVNIKVYKNFEISLTKIFSNSKLLY